MKKIIVSESQLKNAIKRFIKEQNGDYESEIMASFSESFINTFTEYFPNLRKLLSPLISDSQANINIDFETFKKYFFRLNDVCEDKKEREWLQREWYWAFRHHSPCNDLADAFLGLDEFNKAINHLLTIQIKKQS